MRPARKGPENGGTGHTSDVSRPAFNEAGPQGAGKHTIGPSLRARPPGSFNEAGPQGAGKHGGAARLARRDEPLQ